MTLFSVLVLLVKYNIEQYSGRHQMVTEIIGGNAGGETGHPTAPYYENKVRCIYFIVQFEFIIGCS